LPESVALKADEQALTEDTELTVRLYQKGYRVKFIPTAVSEEQEPERLATWMRQRTRWARGNNYIIAKFQRSMLKKSNRLISLELMNLLKWISEYYICHLGEAYRLIQSQLNVEKSRVIFRRVTDISPGDISDEFRQVLENIPKDKSISLVKLRHRLGSRFKFTTLADLEKNGIITKQYSEIRKKEIYLHEDYYHRSENRKVFQKQADFLKRISARKNKSWEILEYLLAKKWVSMTDLRTAGYRKTVLEKLVEKELLLKKTEVKPRVIPQGYQEEIPKIKLTSEQLEIVKDVSIALEQGSFQAYLLHGITGSGFAGSGRRVGSLSISQSVMPLLLRATVKCEMPLKSSTRTSNRV